ncbi:MAG TPA: RsmE family RNA methyltransferase [Herpetosiphonaceae bacterium]|nr:RsmE family RNA methyltransferase [Herpetosiphonaceae bacterium]
MPKRPQRPSPGNTYRFFVAPTAIRGHDVHIDDGALLHQLGSVLRLQPADRIVLLDNTGFEYTVVIRSIGRQEVTGYVEACIPARGEPHLRLALYVALLKGDRFELVLQKGTELGASRFVPLVTARSLADPATGATAARRERWERIIRESAEQSRRGRLPVLAAPQPFRQACIEATGEARTMLLWEGQDAQSLADVLAAGHDEPRPLALFSGPEGGWTEDEVATAVGYNMIPVSLGPRILRAETAPIAAAAAIFFEHGDLG